MDYLTPRDFGDQQDATVVACVYSKTLQAHGTHNLYQAHVKPFYWMSAFCSDTSITGSLSLQC